MMIKKDVLKDLKESIEHYEVLNNQLTKLINKWHTNPTILSPEEQFKYEYNINLAYVYIQKLAKKLEN